jgi:hypothetical protein
MSLAHLNAFKADVDAIKSGSRFYHPTVNYGDRFGRESSVANLVTYLNVNLHASLGLVEAMERAGNPDDTRLKKYMPAIERLVRVWGTAANYPAIPPTADPDRDTALFNFARAIRRLMPPERPSWLNLEDPATGLPRDSVAFGAAFGPGYLDRIRLADGSGADITARSLLLAAGLVPQPPGNPTGYIANLGLTLKELEAMKNGSVLDVGCGAAFFCAEMRALFGCQANGMDLHPVTGIAINNAKKRYVKAMLYLKMLRDRRRLPQDAEVPAWAFNLIDRIVENLPEILREYDSHTPAAGDLLHNFATTARGIRQGGWSHSVTVNVLGYFDAAQQTTAVDALCTVTGRRVHVNAGGGALRRLDYDQQTIRGNHPGCVITPITERTHRIDK